MLIGDNLASHISPAVIDSCKENDIEFVCLVPNSTDKLQPLDVGVFAPLKFAWRDVLQEYKTKYPNKVGIDKGDFPSLLAKTLAKADPGKNMAAAFSKCGLWPVSYSKAVELIPSRDMECEESVRDILNSTLGEKLDQLRGSDKDKKPRGKKIKVPAGMSYSAVVEDDVEDEDMDVDELLEGTSSSKQDRPSKKKSRKQREDKDEDDDEEEEEDDSDEVEYDDDSDEDLEQEEGEEEDVQPQKKKGRKIADYETDSDEELPDVEESGRSAARGPDYPVGSFVVAVYDGLWYIAQVEGEEPDNECPGFTLLKYMERRGDNQFVWGKVKDTLKTHNGDILLQVDPPVPVSSRLFGLPKVVVNEVDKLFRVKWSIILYSPKKFVLKFFLKLQNFQVKRQVSR